MAKPLVNTGVYNLLISGTEWIHCSPFGIACGNNIEMRLVLGSNNRVKVDGEYHDLDTPSAQQSGLKFNIHATLTAESFTVCGLILMRHVPLLKKEWRYSLKPVIRTYTDAIAVPSAVTFRHGSVALCEGHSQWDTIGTFAERMDSSDQCSTGRFVFCSI